MADVIKLSVFAVICCAITLTVRAYRPELARQAAVAAGAMVLIYAMEKLGGIFGEIKTMLETYGVPSELLTVLIKLTGIVYLVQFAADACRDASESAIAGRVELAGRIMIVSLCIPCIKQAMDMIARLMEGAG